MLVTYFGLKLCRRTGHVDSGSVRLEELNTPRQKGEFTVLDVALRSKRAAVESPEFVETVPSAGRGLSLPSVVLPECDHGLMPEAHGTK